MRIVAFIRSEGSEPSWFLGPGFFCAIGIGMTHAISAFVSR